MEQHPIPRNVTSFEFHLIGDMSLRQFGYLSTGVLTAYMIYRTSMPDIFKYSLMGIVGLTGFAFAFLPIQERPLDKWLVAFAKSIISPTQYLWQKSAEPPDILLRSVNMHILVNQTISTNHQDSNDKLNKYLASLPAQPHENINRAEKIYIQNTLHMFDTSGQTTLGNIPVIQPQMVSNFMPSPLKEELHAAPSAPINTNSIDTILNNKTLQPAADNSQPANASVNPSQPATNSIIPSQPITNNSQPITDPDSSLIINNQPLTVTSFQPTINSGVKINFQSQFERITREREKLEKEMQALEAQIKSHMQMTQNQAANPETTVKPTPNPVIPPPANEPAVKTVIPTNAKEDIGIPNYSQTPNIVMGVIKDPQRKLLPNIILTIKDKDNIPLRALKTNKLGQFAIATPLISGTYFLEIEDPMKRYVFDTAELILTGKVFLPIEIVAKGEKELMRDKLANEIFGNPGVF